MFRRFVKRFEYQDPLLGKITYPRGWAGELDEDVIEKADALNALLVLPERSAVTVGAGESLKPNKKQKPVQKSDELVAAEQAVLDAEAKVIASVGDAIAKIDAEADLVKAKAALELLTKV